MSEEKIVAFRGFWVNLEDIISLIISLLGDVKERKDGIVVVDMLERAKLNGAVMSLQAIQEALMRYAIFGDLFPKRPEKNNQQGGEKKDVNTILGENGSPIIKEEEDGPP